MAGIINMDQPSTRQFEESLKAYHMSCKDFHRDHFQLMESSLQIYKNRPVDFMSVGCGYGVLDNLIVMETPLSVSSFYGIEPNDNLADEMKNVVEGWKIEKTWIDRRPYSENFQLLPEATKKYDIILLSHILYYFSNSMSIINQILNHLKSDGRLFICHDTAGSLGEKIVAPLTANLVSDLCPKSSAVTSEEIEKGILEKGLQCKTLQSIGQFNFSDLIELKQPNFGNLLTFYTHCDSSKFDEETVKRIVEHVKGLATYEADKQWYIYGGFAVLEVKLC